MWLPGFDSLCPYYEKGGIVGDRANVYVKNDVDPSKPGVYLYTHWGGYELPEAVAKALDRGRNRWDDGPYLTRIIFCEMMKFYGDLPEETLESETGFGISTSMVDNEHNIIVVEPGSRDRTDGRIGRIWFARPGNEDKEPVVAWSFEVYVDKWELAAEMD